MGGLFSFSNSLLGFKFSTVCLASIMSNEQKHVSLTTLQKLPVWKVVEGNAGTEGTRESRCSALGASDGPEAGRDCPGAVVQWVPPLCQPPKASLASVPLQEGWVGYPQ